MITLFSAIMLSAVQNTSEEDKKGYVKHKGKVKEAGYEGQVEPTSHTFKNVKLHGSRWLQDGNGKC